MASAPILLRTVVPTMDLADNVSPKCIVTESPQEFRVVQIPATSFSQSNANWNIIPPSPSTIISRYVRVNLPLQFSITGTASLTGNNQCFVVNSSYSGPCQYPLHTIISTLTITFNNQAITIRPSQIFDKFHYYNFGREEQKGTLSTTPSYPDQTTNNIDTGTITSPFASYSSSVDHISRNSIPINWSANPVLTNGQSGTAIFTLNITEPLMINPLIFDNDWWRKPGITQITNFTVTMNFDPVGLSRVWRQAIGDPVKYSNVSVTIQQPSLALIYYTLPTYMNIPPSISYPYTAVQNYTYTFSTPITQNTPSVTLTSNTIQFQSIPHRIYVGVSKNYNSKTINDNDCFLPITNVNITWGNVSGVLSTLTQQDLYLLCLKNGLKQSWSMFSGNRINFYSTNVSNGSAQQIVYTGPSAPLCLEFGSDIQLLNEDFPGRQGTWNFQITVQANNTLPDVSYTCQMDIIVLYMGTMTIANQSVTLNTGLITPNTPIPELTKTTFPNETDFYAGGKFDLGSILSSIPGRIMKGLSGLVSGLLGPEQENEHPIVKTARRVARRYIPPPPQEEYEEEEEVSICTAY
jgi:hypothetical protein